MTTQDNTPAPVMTVRAAPGRLPLLGHLLAFGRRPLDFLTELPAHGDLVEIRLGRRTMYVVCHPTPADQVLRDGRTFDKGGFFYDQARLISENGLATCLYEQHRRQRPLAQPAFHPDRTAGYTEVMTEQIAAILRSWRHGQVIDIPAAMHAIVVRIMTRTLYALSLTDEENENIYDWVSDAVTGAFRQMFIPAHLKWLPIPGNRTFRQAMKRLDKLVYRAIAVYQGSAVDHDDLLSKLVTARDENGDSFTDREIRDQVITFITGGTETTSSLLAWTLFELARHPEVNQRLHSEVDTVLNGRGATYADIPHLDYTRRVLTEALRLHPPIWLVTRQTATDTHIAGHPVPAGSNLLCCPYQLYRRSDLFPDPLRFSPDRWPPEYDVTRSHSAFTPFGIGARKCIGDRFGLLEATLALASIAAHWRLELLAGVTTRHRIRLVLQPHPLPMRLHQRHPSTTPGVDPF